MRFLSSRPAGRIKKRHRLAYAVSLGFGWGKDIGAKMQSVVTHRQNRGFPKGGLAPPLWHTTLLARLCVIRSVGVAAKMRLPPGRTRGFEAAKKQGCDCVSWSRKHISGFISRQGVYESPRPSFYAPTCGQNVPKLWPQSRKSSRTAGNRQG